MNNWLIFLIFEIYKNPKKAIVLIKIDFSEWNIPYFSVAIFCSTIFLNFSRFYIRNNLFNQIIVVFEGLDCVIVRGDF